MSFPPSLTTRTVQGRFVTYPDGVPAEGSVRIVLEDFMQGPTDNAFVAPFDETFPFVDGVVSITLPSNNDPQWTSGIYRYVLTVGTKQRRGTLLVPYDGTDAIELADVLNLPSPTPGEAYIIAASKGAPGGVASLGSDGKVIPSQLPASAGGSASWLDLTDKPSTFPPSAHAHPVTDVTGLQASLDSKADSSTVNTALAAKADITSVNTSLAAKADSTALTTGLAGKANTAHTHPTADVTGLDTALAAKADTSALTSGLSGKANTVHSHVTADVTGLDTALAGKAASSHSHVQSDVTGLVAALAGKADASSVGAKLLVLGPTDPVPGGTPAGTAIIRTTA